jgi:hypothetical protein
MPKPKAQPKARPAANPTCSTSMSSSCSSSTQTSGDDRSIAMMLQRCDDQILLQVLGEDYRQDDDQESLQALIYISIYRFYYWWTFTDVRRSDMSPALSGVLAEPAQYQNRFLVGPGERDAGAQKNISIASILTVCHGKCSNSIILYIYNTY